MGFTIARLPARASLPPAPSALSCHCSSRGSNSPPVHMFLWGIPDRPLGWGLRCWGPL